MSFFVYILYSVSMDRYYVGFSRDVEARIAQHRDAERGWTSRADDWSLVHEIAAESEGEARVLERRIKKRGARRFLADTQKSSSLDISTTQA